MVSVILPVYNLSNYIAEALNSLKQQVYDDFEVIIVDDGSTDDTVNVIKQIISQDERFRLFCIANSGVSAARKFGIEKSLGNYLAFMDGDDTVESNWLDILVGGMKKHNADISVTGYNLFFDKKNKKIPMSDERLQFKVVGLSVLEEWISADHFQGFLWDKLFKRSLFSNIQQNITYTFMEDVSLINQFIDKVNVLVFNGIPTYNYRQRKTSKVHSAFRYSDFSTMHIVTEMLQLSNNNCKLVKLSYKRLSIIAINLFRSMSKQDIKNYDTEITCILTTLRNAKKNGNLIFNFSIKDVLINLLISTNKIFLFSRIYMFLIRVKHFIK